MDKLKTSRSDQGTVSPRTYCRHGFHDWMIVEQGPDEQKSKNAKRVLKCQRCGKYRYMQTQ